MVLREREIMTRSSVLRGNKNFTHAINLAQQLVLKKEIPNARPIHAQKPGGNYNHYILFILSYLIVYLFSASQTSGHKSVAATSSSSKSAAVKSQKLSSKDKIPLIIVPAAPTAKFTLYNIKQFLEDQK